MLESIPEARGVCRVLARKRVQAAAVSTLEPKSGTYMDRRVARRASAWDGVKADSNAGDAYKEDAVEEGHRR